MPIQAGVRQGCPLSPALYLFVAHSLYTGCSARCGSMWPGYEHGQASMPMIRLCPCRTMLLLAAFSGICTRSAGHRARSYISARLNYYASGR